MKGVGIEKGLQNVEAVLKVDPEEDMNKLTDTELKRRKDAGEENLTIRNDKIVEKVPFPGGAQRQTWASRFR